MRVIPPSTGGVPIRIWARTVPAGAIAQLQAIARQPYVVEHVAAMPDVHVASGVAVGTVFATDGVVVPGALGGDLGCGVSALRFELPASALGPRELGEVLRAWARVIPVGDQGQRGRGLPLPPDLASRPLSTRTLEHTKERLGPRHLGTLGGGNHFVELDRDTGGGLWLLVHSGSRGLGAAIGAHHQRAAQAEGLGELPGLRVDTPTGAACLGDVAWALDFARANRDALVREAADTVRGLTGAAVDESSRIDLHHNFVRREAYGGRSVWIHRKGAIAAELGTRAVIPGSMGTASYVVEGLGEASSFQSASHGAGRVLTRKEARARIRPQQLVHSLRRVVFDAGRAAELVEEAPQAYRDIREVLEDEEDLVRPVLRLEPIAVLKG